MSLSPGTQTSIREYFSGTYVICRRFLYDPDVFATFTVALSGGRSMTTTIEQVKERCRVYDPAGNGTVSATLLGGDVDADLNAIVVEAMRQFVIRLITNWRDANTLWTGRGFAWATLSGTTVADDLLTAQTASIAWATLTPLRNKYRDGWLAVIGGLNTFVTNRLNDAGRALQIATEPVTNDVRINPTIVLKGLAQTLTNTLVVTLPVIRSGSTVTAGGTIVSDGATGRVLTNRGVVYGTLETVTKITSPTANFVDATAPAAGWSNWRGNYSVTIPASAFPTNGTTYYVRAYVQWGTSPNFSYSYGRAVEVPGFAAATVSVGAVTIGTVTNTTFVLPGQTKIYDFSSHTFTSCGATGHTGPSLTACRNTYSQTSWAGTYLNMSTTGIQRWTVPEYGEYLIEAVGGSGGSKISVIATGSGNVAAGTGGYNGAYVGKIVTLNTSPTQVLNIIVGQNGLSYTGNVVGHYGGGGGGASVVYINTSVPILVAGGGSGASSGTNACGSPANSSDSILGVGTSLTNVAGAGASWDSVATNGGALNGNAQGGFLTGRAGGFGGGGWALTGGGGGGGYRGGSHVAQTPTGTTCSDNSYAGGSYVSDTLITPNTNVILPPQVKITRLQRFTVQATIPITITSNGTRIASYGIIWSTNSNADNLTIALTTKTSAAIGIGGTISATLTGIISGINHYIRGYALDDAGAPIYSTGTMPTFILSMPAALTNSGTVSVANNPTNPTTQDNFTIQGFTFAASPTPPYTERGIVWSAVASTVGTLIKGAADVTDVPLTSAETSKIITRDKTCTAQTINFRVYVSNAVGTTYGSIITGTSTVNTTPVTFALRGDSIITDTGAHLSLNNANISSTFNNVRLAWTRQYNGSTTTVATIANRSPKPVTNSNFETTIAITTVQPSWVTNRVAAIISLAVQASNTCDSWSSIPDDAFRKFKLYNSAFSVQFWPGKPFAFPATDPPTSANTLMSGATPNSGITDYLTSLLTVNGGTYSPYINFLPDLTAIESTNFVGFNFLGGYQEWTVPRTGIYKVEAYGATPVWNFTSAGQQLNPPPNQVSYVLGHYSFPANEKVTIIVGQPPKVSGGASGGGGASAVYYGTMDGLKNNSNLESRLLMVAGGTGGFGFGQNLPFATMTPGTAPTPGFTTSMVNSDSNPIRHGEDALSGTTLVAHGGAAIHLPQNDSTKPQPINKSGNGGGFGGYTVPSGGADGGFGGGGASINTSYGGGGGGICGGKAKSSTAPNVYAEGGKSYINTTRYIKNSSSRTFTAAAAGEVGAVAYSLQPVSKASQVIITWVAAI